MADSPDVSWSPVMSCARDISLLCSLLIAFTPFCWYPRRCVPGYPLYYKDEAAFAELRSRPSPRGRNAPKSLPYKGLQNYVNGAGPTICAPYVAPAQQTKPGRRNKMPNRGDRGAE